MRACSRRPPRRAATNCTMGARPRSHSWRATYTPGSQNCSHATRLDRIAWTRAPLPISTRSNVAARDEVASTRCMRMPPLARACLLICCSRREEPAGDLSCSWYPSARGLAAGLVQARACAFAVAAIGCALRAGVVHDRSRQVATGRVVAYATGDVHWTTANSPQSLHCVLRADR